MSFAPIALYIATCAAALTLASRFFRRIPLPWAAALALLPLAVTGKALVTGGYFGPLNLAYAASPLSSRGGPDLHRDRGNGLWTDVAFQMVPWQAAIRADVRAGYAPLWNPSILCGDVLAGAAQPGPFHPSSFLGILLPPPAARTFAATLGLFVGALCGFLFLRDLGLDPVFAFFGAAAWMLSFHFVFWTGWPQAQTWAPLPLVMSGMRRVARRMPGGIGATTAAMALSLVGGHPESAFHVALVAGLWFLWELPRSPARGRAIRDLFGAGLLAFALAAPAVLPVLEALPQTKEAQERSAAAPSRTSNALVPSMKSAIGAVFPDFYGRWLASSNPSAPSFDSATAASVGGIAMTLALVSLFSPRREKWPLAILAAGTLAIAAGVPVVADVANRLPVLRLALNNRVGSATAFLVAALAALGLEELGRATLRRALVLPAAAVAAAAAVAWRRPVLVSRGVDPAYLLRAGAFFVAGVLGLFVLRIALGRPERLAFAAVPLFLLVRLAEVPRPSPTFSAADFYPRVPELDEIRRGGEPGRIAGLGNALLPNQSTMYGVEDVRGYEGVNNARLLDTYPLWCVPQRLWFNRVDDPERPFLRFLNARFLAADPSFPPPLGWRPVSRGAALAIFENPAALPRAFAPKRVRFVSDPSRTIAEMSGETDFARVAWIEAPGEQPREIENGAAAVRVREVGPDLVLDVDAAAPAWIVASETNWKGWRAREGNTRFPIRFANHAFLAFRVPAGRHRVRLGYRPASFAIGLALAAAAMTVSVAWGVTSRRLAAPVADRPGPEG